MLKQSWDWISNMGLPEDAATPLTKRIRITNQLIAISFIFTLVFIFAYAAWGLTDAVKIEAGTLIAYLLLFIISHYRYHHLVKILFVTSLYLHLFALCLCFGESSQAHLLFIPVGALPLVLFDLKHSRTIISLSLLCLAIFATLYLLNFSSSFSVVLPAGTLVKMKLAFNASALIGEVIIIYSFIGSIQRYEKKLNEKNTLMQEQLQAIFENSFDALFLVDWQKRRIIKANQRAVELFGMDSEQDFYDKYGTDLHKEFPSEAEMETMRTALNTKGFYEGEVLYRTKKGDEFWGALAIKLVLIGDQKFQSVRVTDITAEKKSKVDVQTSLNEKEILLSEIHHRVKNNMAVISGLLGLQSNYVEDENARLLFEESRNRIHSMALIHDKLYQHETFARIDFNAYCNDLINFIKKSYSSDEKKISFSIICNDVFVDIKNAVPCGLILNELLSNAYKHAFKGRQDGEIKVVCTKMGGKFTMSVSDNGIGYDAESKIEKPASLGLTLITALTEQVSGSIKTTNKNGTTYYLSFEE
ncbi:MAG: two-component hybrid sensor and regulator [Bacteroidetes bacterium]|jgi:PAS domain S-box-containing protein|nr:two-component hybrid sensor and regulator [Bacteroidota bacterium]